jgi:hypothetical protein
MADTASQKAPNVPSSKKSNAGSEAGSLPKNAKKNVSQSAPSQLDGAESHVPENAKSTANGTQNGTQNGDYEEEVSPYFWSSAPRTARDIYSHNVLQPAGLVWIKADLTFYSKPKTEPKHQQKHQCQMRKRALKRFQLAP